VARERPPGRKAINTLFVAVFFKPPEGTRTIYSVKKQEPVLTPENIRRKDRNEM